MYPLSILNDIVTPTVTHGFALALAGLIQWLASDHGAADDQEVVECHDFVMECLADADLMRSLECLTERDLRGQLSLAQVLDLQKERDLRKQRGRN